VCEEARIDRMLDENSRFAGSVGCSTRQGNCAENSQPASVGICPWFLNLTDNIKRPKLGNRDGYFGVFEVLSAKFLCQCLLELRRSESCCSDCSGQRKRNKPARINLIIAAERGFAVDGHADFFPSLQARRAFG